MFKQVKSDLFKVTGPSTQQDWVRMVEARAEQVFSVANLFTLPKLGDLGMYDRKYPTVYQTLRTFCSLPMWKVTERPHDFGYETQGIFYEDLCGPHLHSAEFWGLTRSQVVLIGKISRLDAQSNTLTIEADKTDLGELSVDHLRRLWLEFSKQIDSWHENATKRKQATDNLVAVMNIENELMRLSRLSK